MRNLSKQVPKFTAPVGGSGGGGAGAVVGLIIGVAALGAAAYGSLFNGYFCL